MSPDSNFAKTQAVDRYRIAEDFRTAMNGILADEQISAAMHTMLTTTTSYPAKGNVVSMIFYLQFQVIISGGRTFEGKGGGISWPGAGALFGELFTSNLERLYQHTVSMQFHVTPAYANLNFFDTQSNLLGNFYSGSIAMVQGVGGGYGKWEQPIPSSAPRWA